MRYAIFASKIETVLGRKPHETFETDLEKTVDWYLENREWCAHVLEGSNCSEHLERDDSYSIQDVC